MTDWEQFRIDYTWDNEGTRRRKLEGFMHAVLDEKKTQANVAAKTGYAPKKAMKKARRKRN